MNIKQLIKFLEKLPEDTIVMTNGYEGGYCDIVPSGTIVDMCLDYNDESVWWEGPHELAEDVSEKQDYKQVKTIIL
jgi:hypothetical protein